MEIIHSKTSIKPYIDENGYQCTINEKFNTNVAESLSSEPLFTKERFDYLEKQPEEQVKKMIEKIIRYAQEKQIDIFGIVSDFTIRYPMMKDELKEEWKDIFSEIKFNVEVDSKINRTYLIRDPANLK